MHLKSIDELFAYKLGTAVTMEHDSLDMLGQLEEAAMTAEVKEMFAHHAAETREQIQNLTAVFELTGLDLKEKPSPTTKGLADEGRSLLGKVADEFRDVVALSAAGCTEHFEIASYRSLIALGEIVGGQDVADLLTANLSQEEHTAAELEKMLTNVSGEFASLATDGM